MKVEEIDALLGGEAQRLSDQYREMPLDFMDGYGWAVTQICRLFRDATPVIKCKECKHRPIGGEAYNHTLIFPDECCPCNCVDDNWYSWMPDDNWFCGNGERKDNGNR